MKWLFILCLVLSCKKNEIPQTIREPDPFTTIHSFEPYFVYPPEIGTPHLRELYDKAKWTLYCIGCDDTAGISEDGQVVTFGMMELTFDTLLYRNDLVALVFSYKNPIPMMGGAPFGIIYKQFGTIVKAYIIRRGTLEVGCNADREGRNRYCNPLQPDVISYINQTKDKLAPWFLNEARKRGVCD